MVHKLHKKQKNVDKSGKKLAKCSFVLAAISSFGIAASVIPFIVGPPPFLNEGHHDFPEPHGPPHHGDHDDWKNTEHHFDMHNGDFADRWSNDEP